MITYVNTVLVSPNAAAIVSGPASTSDAGKFVILINEGNGEFKYASAVTDDTVSFRVGLVTKNTFTDHAGNQAPVIKWSDVITKEGIKAVSTGSDAVSTAESVEVGLSEDQADLIKTPGLNVVLRLTFKDLPNRFRKWTNSYSVVTKKNMTAEQLFTAFANAINGNKEARVTAEVATVSGAKVLVVTAKEYDDDNAVETLNWTGKVRFEASMYYTDPQAAGFASHNKYAIGEITKTAGVINDGEWKRVRDHESKSLGYEGILNQGQGTFPIIKPALMTEPLDDPYKYITIEYEPVYRAADDIHRRAKKTLEIFVASGESVLLAALFPQA